MSKPQQSHISKAMATIGAIGGKNGMGPAKKRDPAHYKRLADMKKARAREKRGKAVKSNK